MIENRLSTVTLSNDRQTIERLIRGLSGGTPPTSEPPAGPRTAPATTGFVRKFPMDVRFVRGFGLLFMAIGLFGAIVAVGYAWLLAPDAYPEIGQAVSFALLFPGFSVVVGAMILAACLPSFRSRVRLDTDRVTVYPNFKRAPHVLTYQQLAGLRLSKGDQRIELHYYPLGADGQPDTSKLRNVRLPFTLHRRQLFEMLRQRATGQPPSKLIIARYTSWQFLRPWLALGVLVAILLMLTPDAPAQMPYLAWGLLVYALILFVGLGPWLLPRRK